MSVNNVDMKELQHAGELLASLAELRHDPESCDVLLQAENTAREAARQGSGEMAGEARGVWAHRVVLAAASPYFCTMFKSSYEKCTMQVIVIKNVDLETLRALVCNIYSPVSLPVSIEKLKALLKAATLLDVDDVRDTVSTYLQHTLTGDNVLDIRTFAERHADTALVTAANQYIHDHFDQVLKSHQLLELTLDALVALLNIDRNAATEECVLDAVLRWAQHYPQVRRQHLHSLLQRVRLQLVPRDILSERSRVEPLVTEQRALIQVIQALTADRELPGPTHLTKPAALLVIGGNTDDGNSSSVLRYSLPNGTWQSVAELSRPRAAAGTAILDDRVYLIGGRNGSFTARTVFMYDPATDSWLPGPTLNTARRWPGVAALAGKIYALGGWNDDNNVLSWILSNSAASSAEALDPRTGVWLTIPAMTTRRRGHGTAALNGKLYAIGGHDGRNTLNTVERYDPVAGKWETVEAMKQRRDALRVGVLDDTIYAVGGYNGSDVMPSMERYRAGMGWEFAPAMAAGRSCVAVATHHGRLYAAGGYDGRKYSALVTMFNPVTAEWSELPSLPAGRSVAAAVVVNWPPSTP